MTKEEKMNLISSKLDELDLEISGILFKLKLKRFEQERLYSLFNEVKESDQKYFTDDLL